MTLKSVSGSLSVKTDKMTSKIQIPAKAPVNYQLRDLLSFVKGILDEYGDDVVKQNFADSILGKGIYKI